MVFAAVLALSGILQTVLVSARGPLGAAPDFLLAMLAVVALRGWPVWAFAALGLVKDFLSVGPFGAWAFAFTAAGLTGQRLGPRVFQGHALTQAAAGAILALLAAVLYLGFSGEAFRVCGPWKAGRFVAGETIAAMVLVPIVFRFAGWGLKRDGGGIRVREL
ncbi:MAG: hypothetical protein V1809_00650 [Planctomycetota bacterium]